MKFFLAVSMLAMVAFAPFASAECEKACSLNGRCTNFKATLSTASDTVRSIAVPSAHAPYGYDTNTPKKDSCTCFTRVEDSVTVYAFTGADCSLKTCPHGASWDRGIQSNNNHDKFAECSDRGICDRS